MAVNDDIFATLRSYSGSINDKLKAFWIAVGNGLFSGGGIPNTKAPGVIGQSAAIGMSVTGTTSPTTLASIVIPANALGLNGRLRICSWWSYTNSSNTKTLGANIGGIPVLSQGVTTTATEFAIQELMNQNSMTNQFRMSSFVNTNIPNTNAFSTHTIDFTTAQTLNFTGTLTNTGETITLVGYSVEILNP